MTPLSHEAIRHLQRVLGEGEPSGGRYEVGEAIGQGGMGTVYRAYDRTLDREVALKILKPDVTDAETAARLEREARILARLEHPGIVPVHDAGVLTDGRSFYVMKLARGERLEEAVRDLPLAEALRLFLRVCETVGFAHARGVVHRDLKPSNIMIGAFGEVLVLDWGIARLTREQPEIPEAGAQPVPSRSESSEPDTAPGTILGTPGFMAPEQAQGWQHLVDGRSDVYALGAILRRLTSAPAGALASIAARATAPDPGDRYPSAAALAADITRFLDGEPVQAHRETTSERLGRLFRKYQTAIVLVLTYLLIRFLFLATRGL